MRARCCRADTEIMATRQEQERRALALARSRVVSDAVRVWWARHTPANDNGTPKGKKGGRKCA